MSELHSGMKERTKEVIVGVVLGLAHINIKLAERVVVFLNKNGVMSDGFSKSMNDWLSILPRKKKHITN